MSSANIAAHNSGSNADAVVPSLDEVSKVDNLTEAVPLAIATFSDVNTDSVIPPPTVTTATSAPAAISSEAFPLPNNSAVSQTIRGNDMLHRPMESSVHTDKMHNSGTPLSEGRIPPLTSAKQSQGIHNSSQDDNNNLSKDSDVDVYRTAGLVPESNDIASDIQERSSIGDSDGNSIKLDDDEATGPEFNKDVNSVLNQAQDISLPTFNNNTQISPKDLISEKPINGDEGKTNNANTNLKPSIEPANEKTASIAVHSEDMPPQISLSGEDMVSGEGLESMPSYMSPNHEWARILQRRLGKGLSDAQMLARSNSMLASPSILAQSLTQVIPNLQVKDTGAMSPGSSNRGYQTAEELFDRPASIEPSGPAFQYDDQNLKDVPFPSSTLNNSQAPLLLFASLNPDQLLGKKSSSKQPTAPPAPSPAEKLSQPPPVSASSTQQKSQVVTAVLNSASQPSVPIIPIPIPPIAVASSPTTRAPVISPVGVETNQSPLVSRDPGVTGPKNLGQSQEEKLGAASNATSNPRMLLAQGSSSSLTGVPSTLKDQQTSAVSNYPSHIQYTPITTYKSNPAKENSKLNKKVRDISNISMDVTAVTEIQPQSDAKDSILGAAAPTAVAPAVLVASTSETVAGDNVAGLIPVTQLADSTAEWMETLSGFSEVNFDATLNVSAAMIATVASTSLSKDAPANNPIMIPPISEGIKSGGTVIETSTKNTMKIPSPFNSVQTANENDTTTEIKSQPLNLPAIESVQNNAPILPPSSAPIYSTTSAFYPGIHQPVTQPNYIPQDQTGVAMFQQHGGRAMHQANKSISSLWDVQSNSSHVERGSQDFSHQRRNDLDYPQSSIISTPTVVPPSYNLGSAYQISWLPQSQPILPPRADINSIDVPELTERQLLPLDPRPLDVDSVDPCFKFNHIGEAIRHWGQHTPAGNAFASINGFGVESGSWDWSSALGRAEMIAKSIHDKSPLRPGARVALVFRLSEILDFVAAFYGSILAGMVPVLINQIQDFSEMVYIMTSANVELALTTQVNHKSLLTDLKKGAAWPAGVTWWQTDKLETWTPKNQQERLPITEHEFAYIEYTKSTAGELKGVAVSHKGLITQCQALYNSFSWRPALYRDKTGIMQTDPQLAADPTAPPANDRKKKSTNKRPAGTTMSWLEPRQQSGLVLGAIMGVFTGNFTVFMDTSITAISGLWAHTIAMYRANIAFGDYTGIQKLLRNFKSNPQATITPVRPDLRFLHTVYVDTQYNNSVVNREFLDDFLYPLGMIPRQDSAQNRNTDLDAKESPSNPISDENSGTKRSDSGLIAFLSLPEIGGMVLCLRDNLDPPSSIERIDLRKRYRKSALPRARLGSVDVSRDITGASNELRLEDSHLQIPGSEQAVNNSANRIRGELLNHSLSSMTSGHYLLHRESLRLNRVVLLATGEEAFRRKDELGAILVGAFGYPLAQTTAFVVDPETLALSLPDVLGEIWVSSPGMPVSFWGLPEHTQDIFNAKPYIVKEDTMIPSVYRPADCDKLLRTGLLGTIIEGRVVIFGSYWDRLKQDMADPMKPFGVEFEYHHCNDLTNTLMTKVPGIGELSIFESVVNGEYLPVVCIELIRDGRWNGQNLNTVAQHIAVNSRHFLREVNGLRSYCVAVWDENTLPRLFDNGRRVVDHALCKRMFELGRIYKMLYFGTFTDDVLFNIPRGDDIVNGFWSRECVVKRQRRQGAAPRYVQYASNTSSPDVLDERANVYMGRFHSITDVLIWRTIIQPDEIAFIDLDVRGKEQKSITFKKFNHKVTGYAMHLEKKHGLKAGDHVILWFSQELDFVITLHACWVLGLIPIPLQLPESSLNASNHIIVSGSAVSSSHIGSSGLPYNSTPIISTQSSKESEEKKKGVLRTFLRIADEVKIRAILGNSVTDEFLKQKSTASLLRTCRTSFTPNFSQTPEVFSSSDIVLPNFYNVSKATKSKQTLGILSGYAPRKEYFSANYPAVYLIDPEAKSGNIASKKLLKVNHDTLNNLCRNQKLQFKALAGQPVVTSMTIFHGPGFIHGCLNGIYNGGSTIILQPADFYHNPMMWLEAITRYKAQDISLTYPMLDHLLSRLDVTASSIVSLEYIKNFVICNHGRVQQEKNKTAIGRLGALKLSREALNVIYSHPLNPMVTSQIERSSGPGRIHISTKSLRHGIIMTTSESDDPTGIWLEDTGVTTICTSVAIVHPETFEVCAANQIGEIWVHSDSSMNAFYHPPGLSNSASYPQPFNACISGYDTRYRYIRTGDLGFLWNGQQQQQQQQQMNQGVQHNQTGSSSYQLFVLGKLEESFQVQGLLHFAVDIETTVESSHANVAPQGCVTFKTAQGVICVVKVQNQEPEVLVSMYIPLMHAVLEQHQFLPDTIVLVGENVSTARRVSDGLKPRELICTLYSTDRLPFLHLHHSHGKPLPPVSISLLLPVQHLDSSASTSPQSGRVNHPYAQPTSQPQPQVSAPSSRILPGISPAPPALPRSSTSLPPFSNGSPTEPIIAGSNRNSVYGSPLLLNNNIPLPPGVHNPLVHSQLNSNPTAISYQSQIQYNPGSYHPVAGGPLAVSTGHGLNHPNNNHPVSGPTAISPTSRPMSQQGFVPVNTLNSSAVNGIGGSNSSSSLLEEMALYSGRSQSRQAQNQRQPHPRQIQSQEGRSPSSEELKSDSKPGGAVKNIMKGMKWSDFKSLGKS
ncbi:hypothetical protein BGZ76_008786 [Entomortierella beljakovae]|nr:hypothetical protein BGZ76_008786 [Entomortierella beljakovae]